MLSGFLQYILISATMIVSKWYPHVHWTDKMLTWPMGSCVDWPLTPSSSWSYAWPSLFWPYWPSFYLSNCVYHVSFNHTCSHQLFIFPVFRYFQIAIEIRFTYHLKCTFLCLLVYSESSHHCFLISREFHHCKKKFPTHKPPLLIHTC